MTKTIAEEAMIIRTECTSCDEEKRTGGLNFSSLASLGGESTKIDWKEAGEAGYLARSEGAADSED